METNPLKMKPYLCSTFSKSLKSLQYKVYPQWSFKKAISNWTSMPGCTILIRSNGGDIRVSSLRCPVCSPIWRPCTLYGRRMGFNRGTRLDLSSSLLAFGDSRLRSLRLRLVSGNSSTGRWVALSRW